MCVRTDLGGSGESETRRSGARRGGARRGAVRRGEAGRGEADEMLCVNDLNVIEI